MLNNKKNLLQRVRIAMVAIVTIMGLGGALAMKAPVHQAGSTYGSFGLTITGNHYITTPSAVAAGSYSCASSPTACTVISSVAPALRGGNWEIAKVDATVNEQGTFNQ